MFDADNILKAIKEQRAFGPIGGTPRCESCGSFIATYYEYRDGEAEFRQGETHHWERLCGACMARAVAAAQRTPPATEKKKPPTCRYCWKKKKLIGAWCRTCRDNYQRKGIKAALLKVYRGDVLTWEDEQTLAAAPYWAVWKKEFRNVKLP